MNIRALIGRDSELFIDDIQNHDDEICNIVASSSFLVIGGAGSIGQAVVKEIFKRKPQKLHVVDISENNLVELVRDIRSSLGYISGDFKTFCLDVGSIAYDAFIEYDGIYDYVLNLSALKHVRSEKDPFTLMRMIDVNIFNTEKTIKKAIEKGTRKYFCVSTDKATNPVNMMGASKRIMEMFLMKYSQKMDISTARFANVAFSDGSLLYSFQQRIQKKQPIVAPNDIKRYFITSQESGELCLISCLLGENNDVFFPKFNEKINLISFMDIAEKFIQENGYQPHICSSEDEARSQMEALIKQKKWPCYFSASDTTGEKEWEEFYTSDDTIDFTKFSNLGIIKNKLEHSGEKLEYFSNQIKKLKEQGRWDKEDLVELFKFLLPNFQHQEKGKYLDAKM